MERRLTESLESWKESRFRKPLILKGVRQCGKTWLLKDFGRRYYQNVAYFNFDEQPELGDFFTHTKDVRRILQNLAIAHGSAISPGLTLIIFDEIQECNAALNSLKYFCENAPEYHIAGAGSLLGIALSKPASFPVGKVDFLSLFPMTFIEFLLANRDRNLADYIRQIDAVQAIPELFHSELREKLKTYFITGGMPEAVHSWVETGDVSAVQGVLTNLLDAYERDFAKHAEKKDYPKLSLIWQSVPSQLARENKKFLYRVVKEGSRAREYEDALQWLTDAELLYKIYRAEKPGLPISAYDDLSAFKVFVCDIGLLRRLSRLAPSAFTEGNRLFTEFKGALSENYILQALLPQLDRLPRYWTDGKNRNEVDFIIQLENDIIPIEVKSSENIDSKSLKAYGELFAADTKLKVRFSMKNLKLDGNVLNIPLYLADSASTLIKICMKPAPASSDRNT